MFGSDIYKKTSIEKVLENPHHAKASHTKDVEKWAEGVTLKKIFEETAASRGLKYMDVKEIYFNTFCIVSDYMRHKDIPVIHIPNLGILRPNTKVINDLIDEGEFIVKKAIEGGYKTDKEIPPYLTAIRAVRQRTKLENIVKRPSELFRNDVTVEQIDILYNECKNSPKKKRKLIAYIFLNQSNSMELWNHLNKKYNETYKPLNWEENMVKYETKKNNY